MTAARGQKTDLADVHAAIRRWFGDEHDLATVDLLLAAIAAHHLDDGDPLWVLFLGGPGSAKTETLSALDGVRGLLITSTIHSEGALLSGSSQKEWDRGATGGLLIRAGAKGVIVLKDFTTMLSMNREAQKSVMSALREVYDGRWERNLGVDGGRTLSWKGRITLLGAVTSCWDKHYEVISSMGDRFVVLRLDSKTSRTKAAAQAIANTGQEKTMRTELRSVLNAFVDDLAADLALGKRIELSKSDDSRLSAAADVVTRARSAVDHDYRGNVIAAHALEMPTRFVKQLTQVLRGALAIGMERHAALALAIRCARNSVPPMRLRVLCDVAAHPRSSVASIERRLDQPRTTIDRVCQELHALEILSAQMTPRSGGDSDAKKGRPPARLYTVRREVPVDALSPELSEGSASTNFQSAYTDIFGDKDEAEDATGTGSA